MRILASSFLFVLAVGVSVSVWAAVAPEGECLVLDIHEIGSDRLAKITSLPGLDAWLELDNELFACGPKPALEALGELASVERRLGALDRSALRLTYRLSSSRLEELGLRELAAGGLFGLVESPGRPAEGLEEPEGILPFRSHVVLARQVANQPLRARREAVGGTVAGLVAEVDAARWFVDVESLAAFNRYSLGSGIKEARKWLARQFRQLPGLRVKNRFFGVDSVQVANVVATLPGRSRPGDWFVVGGHYDSISNNPLQAAPGAEDNASGCAAVLEMARIFSANPPEATIIFICYAGEEQGLLGAASHVRDLFFEGNAERVAAMLNFDMIGFTEDDDLDCLLQSDSESQFLVEALTDSARSHTGLRLVTSTVLGGSDHVPYAVSSIPAVMSIENDWSTYPHYHLTTDTPDKLTPEMAAEVLRMNVGALAQMTGNTDLSGCLEVKNKALEGARVSWKQPGQTWQSTRTDRQGCFAIDPVTRGDRFKLRISGFDLSGTSPKTSGCVRLLGEAVGKRRVIFRQPGETAQKARTGEDGCFELRAVGGKDFTLIFKGPRVPAI